jgi:hypothetical protein
MDSITIIAIASIITAGMTIAIGVVGPHLVKGNPLQQH